MTARADRAARRLAQSLGPRLSRRLSALGAMFVGWYTPRRLRGRPGLRRRTGQLARSLHYAVTPDGLRVGWFGEAAVYAWTHEEGATIRPVRRRALAWPVGPALTPAGVPRRPGPRHWPELSLRWRRGSDRGVLVHPTRGVMYVLARESRIPPRLDFRASWERWVRREGLRALERELREAVREATRG